MITAVEKASMAFGRGDVDQPIKPYLRFGDPANRIIAMPAYVGDPYRASGIKWIASFPGNIDHGVQRAHSVTVLNRYETGKPYVFFNTAQISGVRTAAVSGLIARIYHQRRQFDKINVGITGFGPIGRFHLDMMLSCFRGRLQRVGIYDIRPIDPATLPKTSEVEIEVVESWEDAYQNADIFITCTVSNAPYIDLPPKKGSLHLNASLRDYCPEFMHDVDLMIVDDWDEVCREATDIEVMHQKYGLQKEDTCSMAELVESRSTGLFAETDTLMFNPMGLAVFDIAVAEEYFREAKAKKIGTELEE